MTSPAGGCSTTKSSRSGKDPSQISINDLDRRDKASPEKFQKLQNSQLREVVRTTFSGDSFVVDQFLEMLHESAVAVFGYRREQLLTLSELYQF